MDHVPKWIAAPASDSLLTQDEVAQKNLIARQRYANKTSGNVKPLESSCGSTQVQGVAGVKGSEKLRITTIMSQKLENWFNNELDPKGSILPTVSIHYGKEGRLELLDDSGFDLSCHQQRTHSFFQEWRELRRQNRLEGLNTEVLVAARQCVGRSDESQMVVGSVSEVERRQTDHSGSGCFFSWLDSGMQATCRQIEHHSCDGGEGHDDASSVDRSGVCFPSKSHCKCTQRKNGLRKNSSRFVAHQV